MLYVHYKPHELKGRYYIELFNEAITLIVFYHLIEFSDFNLNDQFQYELGWSYDGFIILLLLVNIIYIVQAYFESYLTKKNWIRKRKAWKLYVVEREKGL